MSSPKFCRAANPFQILIWYCSLPSMIFSFLILNLDRHCGLLVRVPRFDSWHYQIFWEVVGLEQHPLSLMSTIEELLGKKCSGSSLESENAVVGICRVDHSTSSARKMLVVTLLTSGSRSVSMVHSQTEVTEFVWYWISPYQSCMLLSLCVFCSHEIVSMITVHSTERSNIKYN
jgi:hypothetical protein